MWSIMLKNKTKFIFLYILTYLLTELLKYTTHVLRPDKSDYKSFPSGHMSSVYFSALYFNTFVKINRLFYMCWHMLLEQHVLLVKNIQY